MIRVVAVACLLVTCVGSGGADISSQRCTEYAGYVHSCAADYDMKLVVGKTRTRPAEFPHMAHVGYDGEDALLCGGSLISPNYVLTSAVCLASWQGAPTFVLLGEDGSAPQRIRIAETIPHPDYRNNSVYNDIGLLRLEAAANMSDHVRPACLHRGPALEAGDVATATGWGAEEFGGEPTDSLRKVALPVVAHSICNMTYSRENRRLSRGILDDSQICAGGGKSDTCQGDQGGPVQILVKSPHCMYQIVGITSFGKACFFGAPGVYTRVSYFVPWIEKTVWPSED